MKKMKTPRLPTILNKNIVTFLFAPFIVMVIYHGMPYVYKGVFVIKQKIERIKQPDLSWTMVNVNYTMVQGDAHLIQIKGGKTILIDAGHAEPAKNKLVSFIRNQHCPVRFLHEQFPGFVDSACQADRVAFVIH